MADSLPPGTTPARGLPSPAKLRFPIVPARDLFELTYGKGLVEADRRAGKIPVFGTNGQCGSHDVALFPGPGVILGRKGQGPLGVEWSWGPYWVIDTAYSLTPLRDDVDLRFAYFLFKYIGLNHLKDGTSNPTLSRAAFGAQALPWPEVREQRAIAHILGELDDKIELNRQLNESLEATARALFKSWFVDFDPVREKAEGRRPAGMDEETATLFPKAFADSPAGKIPRSWRSASASDIADINAWTLSASDAFDVVEYVEISGVGQGEVRDIALYPRGSEPSRARRRLRHGDTVLSTVRPERSSYFLALRPSERLIASTGFAVATPRHVPWSFLHVALTRPEVFIELGHLADGGAYPAVRPEVIGGIDVVVPDRFEILERFHARTGPIFEKAHVNRMESRTLAALRDALLPKLLSGEIRVKDAEKMVGA